MIIERSRRIELKKFLIHLSYSFIPTSDDLTYTKFKLEWFATITR